MAGGGVILTLNPSPVVILSEAKNLILLRTGSVKGKNLVSLREGSGVAIPVGKQ